MSAPPVHVTVAGTDAPVVVVLLPGDAVAATPPPSPRTPIDRPSPNLRAAAEQLRARLAE